MGGLSRGATAEGKISSMMLETSINQQKIQESLIQNDQQNRELGDEFKRNNIRIIEVPEEKERETNEEVIVQKKKNHSKDLLRAEEYMYPDTKDMKGPS